MNDTPEEIRQYRQAKLDRRVASMRAKAERLAQEATAKRAPLKSYRGDIAFFTQPAPEGSTFGRQRQRIYRKYGEGLALQSEAQELRESADWSEKRGVAVKGDAERARQAKRENQDKVIVVGSRIRDALYREGAVTRVNKKTYTLTFASGFTCARDKTFVKAL